MDALTSALGSARREMQSGLLHHLLGLITLAALGLAARELITNSPAGVAVAAALLGTLSMLVARRGPRYEFWVSVTFFFALVPLITKAALDMGGASGSALSFAFIPGFLAILVLGVRLGWGVAGLMLLAFVGLYLKTPFIHHFDAQRFVDEVAMTIFGAGLGHSLVRSFERYEGAIEARRAQLHLLHTKREAMTNAIYQRLEPLAQDLGRELEAESSTLSVRERLADVLQKMASALNKARELAHVEDEARSVPAVSDTVIRIQAMRIWLRLAAVLLVFFTLRNIWLAVPFTSPLVSALLCGLFERWLRSARAEHRLEATALWIGLLSTLSVAGDVYQYQNYADAPPLVVMPGTVLFSALLSQGPAAWVVLAANVALLICSTIGQNLTLVQSRLLTDLALSFVLLVVALRAVFALRKRYAQTLIQQGSALSSALRQRRRLAGTLFHDVGNHLQVLTLYIDTEDDAEEWTYARSLGTRVQRLVDLSKFFLLGSQAGPAPGLEEVGVTEAFNTLQTLFLPRAEAKSMQLVVKGEDLKVRAARDLLIDSVLGNLLSNAIKFAPRGSTVALEAHAAQAGVLLTVLDSGPGVPADVMSHLDQEGALQSRVGTAGERGQGYGLQLVREHVQRMGGTLELSPREEGGTRASVWLPPF